MKRRCLVVMAAIAGLLVVTAMGCEDGPDSLPCPSGYTACNDLCVDLVTDPNNCGACDNACEAEDVCSAGLCASSETCEDGECVTGCPDGFGDCDNDPANGCETPLNTVDNCLACGTECDDSDDCTNDVCNTAAGCLNVSRDRCEEPACELAASGCSATDSDGDGFSDAWEDQDYIDINCNGVPDADVDFAFPHETVGGAKIADKDIPNIYVQYDYMGWGAPGIACVTTQNCIDAGQPNEVCHEGHCNHSHQPEDLTFQNVVEAFANHNVKLYIDPVHNEIPHSQVITFQLATDPGVANCAGAVPGALGSYAVNFHDVKNRTTYGGPFDPRRTDVFRYAVFGHYNTCDTNVHCGACPLDRASPPHSPQPSDFGASGLAELPGNDFMVTLGELYFGAFPTDRAGIPLAEAGIFMHELGHTLGLHHNGDLGMPAYSPNYMSVMSYNYVLTGIMTSTVVGSTTPDGPTRLDYSNDDTIETLTESSLDENKGLSPLVLGKKDIIWFTDGLGNFAFGAGAGPIDWNGNGIIDPAPVSVDLNAINGAFDQFRPYNDWVHNDCVTSDDCPFNNVWKVIAHGVDTHEPCVAGKCQSFIYNFQCMPWGIADGPPPPSVVRAMYPLLLSRPVNFIYIK